MTDATTTASTATRNTQNILKREVLLVDIIEECQHRQTATAIEEVDITSGKVFHPILGSILGIVAQTGIDLTKLTLTHMAMGNDVQGFVALAIIHARKLGCIREFVVNLDTIHGFGRQRFDSRRYILAKELLAIDENLLDLFALGLHLTIRDRNTRHLLQQAFDIGIIGHLEGSGIVTDCIAFLRCTNRLGLLDHRFNRHTGFEFQTTQIKGRLFYLEFRFQVIISQKRHYQRVLAIGQRTDSNRTLIARRKVLCSFRCSHRSHR